MACRNDYIYIYQNILEHAKICIKPVKSTGSCSWDKNQPYQGIDGDGMSYGSLSGRAEVVQQPFMADLRLSYGLPIDIY